jgi:ketosteroid isomerase-like protein
VSASANLGLVRSIYAEWERGEFGSAEWAHPQIEWTYVDGPSPGTWYGRSGLIEGRREWFSAWQDLRTVGEDFIEVDAQRVAVLVRFGGQGKTSGLDLTRMGGKGLHVWHVSAGQVSRLTMYFDRDRALADLGLATDESQRR